MKKSIKVVCKATMSDRLELLHQFWKTLLNIDDIKQVKTSCVEESLLESENQTVFSKECRYFFCPVYHCCPFGDEIMPGILGRANKKKFDLNFEELSVKNKTIVEEAGFNDGVSVEVIRGE